MDKNEGEGETDTLKRAEHRTPGFPGPSRGSEVPGDFRKAALGSGKRARPRNRKSSQFSPKARLRIFVVFPVRRPPWRHLPV